MDNIQSLRDAIEAMKANAAEVNAAAEQRVIEAQRRVEEVRARFISDMAVLEAAVNLLPDKEEPEDPGDPEEPEDGIPEGVNQVTIAGESRPVAGVDIKRGDDMLVVYTYSEEQTSSPANQYGSEVAVLGGKVIRRVDRNTAGGEGVPIPPGGYVLSAHASSRAWPDTLAKWLYDRAVPGIGVTLSTVVREPGEEPDPEEPGADGERMPKKVTALWGFVYAPAPNMRDWPDDVKAQVNHVILGLAQGGSGDGRMNYTPLFGQSVADHAEDIREIRSRGVNVVMGFGGHASGIKILNETHVDQAVDFFARMRDTYGINGYDVDLETPDLWNWQSLLSLAKKSRARFGEGWVVGLTVGLWGDREARWYEAARNMAGWYDYFAPMEYDYPESRDDRLIGIWQNKIARMKAGGVPEDKIVMGCMMAETSGYNATQNPSTIVKAWTEAVKKHPNLRGYFVWEDKLMKQRNWDLLRAMRAAGLP